MNKKDSSESENPENKADEQERFMEVSDFEFLQERIKERPINKKKLLQRTIITALMAILFGVLACITFLLLEPVLNNWLYPEEEPGIVTFPQEKDEMLPEDMLTEGGTAVQGIEEESTQADSSSMIAADDTVNNETAAEKQTMHAGEGEGEPETQTEDAIPLRGYQTQYEELYNTYRNVSTSMVTVTAVHSDVDWFNDTYQSVGTTAGVIIANNNRELLILTRKEPLRGAEDIRVSFCNGTNANAEIKQFDSITDLAVLAVDLKYISFSTLDHISLAELGSSAYSGLTGTPVIAVGNLFGYKDNVCYGMITSKENVISLADSEYKLITTDIYASENPSGILVNLEGQVIGIIDNTYNRDDTKNLLSAIGVTELKGIITRLSNGDDIPYLGMYVQDISTEARNELGLPQGAYIFDIDMDSPAMLKGIQKGDILVQFGTQEIESALDYMNALRGASLEQSVRITVLRASVDVYEEMQFLLQPSLQPMAQGRN